MTDWQVIAGDCVEQMAAMDAGSVDAVVCDPPYGLNFMGKEWDRPGAAPEMLGGGNGGSRSNYALRKGDEGYVPGNGAWLGHNDPRAFQSWHEAWAREALRVLKPGGHLLAFGGTRTYHRLACAVEDAGFEIRDCLSWMYGSGFPKSLDVSKAIDKAAGAERDVIGPDPEAARRSQHRFVGTMNGGRVSDDGALPVPLTAPATPDAERWQGWGTALKPAHEPVVLARKPLAGTVAGNVLAHGTGALNVDGCRVGMSDEDRAVVDSRSGAGWGTNQCAHGGRDDGERFTSSQSGRWPANVVLDPEAGAMLDEQTGESMAGTPRDDRGRGGIWKPSADGIPAGPQYGDSGGASRFFYCAKTSSTERNAGLEGFAAVEREGQSAWAGLCNVCGSRMMLNGKPTCGHDDFAWVTSKATRNVHPTVKPIALMRWLIRLVTPPGGLVLDPFAGSGTTGCAAMLEGMRFVGIEREAEYIAIAEARIAWWAEHPEGMELVKRVEAERARTAVADAGQGSLFG